MKISQLNDWLSLVSNAGVLIGLVFLIVEINQSNRIAIAVAEADVRAGLNERQMTMMATPDIREISVKIRNNEPLDNNEQLAAMGIIASQFSIWSGVVEQYNNGVMTEYTLGNYIETVAVFFRDWPGAWPYLAKLRDDFNIVQGINPLWDAYLEELAERDLK